MMTSCLLEILKLIRLFVLLKGPATLKVDVPKIDEIQSFISYPFLRICLLGPFLGISTSRKKNMCGQWLLGDEDKGSYVRVKRLPLEGHHVFPEDTVLTWSLRHFRRT